MYLMAFLIVKKHTFAVLALRIIVFLLDGLGIEVGVIWIFLFLLGFAESTSISIKICADKKVSGLFWSKADSTLYNINIHHIVLGSLVFLATGFRFELCTKVNKSTPIYIVLFQKMWQCLNWRWLQTELHKMKDKHIVWNYFLLRTFILPDAP